MKQSCFSEIKLKFKEVFVALASGFVSYLLDLLQWLFLLF